MQNSTDEAIREVINLGAGKAQNFKECKVKAWEGMWREGYTESFIKI